MIASSGWAGPWKWTEHTCALSLDSPLSEHGNAGRVSGMGRRTYGCFMHERRSHDRRSDSLTPAENAERLKERVYITFAALAVVLALGSDGHGDAGSAARTLFVTVLGTLLAVLVADWVSHIAAHQHLPTAKELRHMVGVSLGALSAVAVPLILVTIAAFDNMPLAIALRASSIVLIVALVTVGYLAVRRVKLPLWQKVLVLLSEAGVGLLVIALEVSAH